MASAFGGGENILFFLLFVGQFVWKNIKLKRKEYRETNLILCTQNNLVKMLLSLCREIYRL